MVSRLWDRQALFPMRRQSCSWYYARILGQRDEGVAPENPKPPVSWVTYRLTHGWPRRNAYSTHVLTGMCRGAPSGQWQGRPDT
jgi:hypothetical protein